jgi:hypothetical protein
MGQDSTGIKKNGVKWEKKIEFVLSDVIICRPGYSLKRNAS